MPSIPPISKEAKQFLMGILGSLVANVIYEGVIKHFSLTFPGWVHLYIFAVALASYYFGLYRGKHETQEQTTTPQEKRVKELWPEIRDGGRELVSFIFVSGGATLPQLISHLEKKGYPKPTEELQRVQRLTTFVLGNISNPHVVFTINPEFKDALKKILA